MSRFDLISSTPLVLARVAVTNRLRGSARRDEGDGRRPWHSPGILSACLTSDAVKIIKRMIVFFETFIVPGRETRRWSSCVRVCGEGGGVLRGFV